MQNKRKTSSCWAGGLGLEMSTLENRASINRAATKETTWLEHFPFPLDPLAKDA